MKCFIHDGRDAQGVCLECGRAMCKNCMKFANYSGLCPNCIKKSLQRRCLNCVVQLVIFLPIIILFNDILMQLSTLSYNIGNFINNTPFVKYIIFAFILWAVIVFIVLIVAIVNITIINNSEKVAKATLFKEKYEKKFRVAKKGKAIEQKRYRNNDIMLEE